MALEENAAKSCFVFQESPGVSILVPGCSPPPTPHPRVTSAIPSRAWALPSGHSSPHPFWRPLVAPCWLEHQLLLTIPTPHAHLGSFREMIDHGSKLIPNSGAFCPPTARDGYLHQVWGSTSSRLNYNIFQTYGKLLTSLYPPSKCNTC